MLDCDNCSTGKVVPEAPRKDKGQRSEQPYAKQRTRKKRNSSEYHNPQSSINFHRRHPADETAQLLALSVKCGIRCIAFASTRALVEWIYDKCLKILKQDPETAYLASKVESYRGGYTMEVRRSIEKRLFQNELLGVIGTCALELGVDIGGIDLTLHCGYPGSYTSLMQQAGRAGRGGQMNTTSFSIIVCWNSPSEQHLWRNACAVLSQSKNTVPCIPIDSTLLKGHLLCASFEFPLVGKTLLSDILNDVHVIHNDDAFSDITLFGYPALYKEACSILLSKGLVSQQITKTKTGLDVRCMRAHPSVQKPWSDISIRSIEPLQYSIVDLHHPLQGRSTDGIKSKKAVLDIISYSRVFYHCFPGAIIMHRARKYKVQSLTKPPNVTGLGYSTASDLVAYVVPSRVNYTTRALQITGITIVKRIECIVLPKVIQTNFAIPGEQRSALVESSVNEEEAIAFILASRFEVVEESKNMLVDSQKNDEEDCSDLQNIEDGPVAGNGVVTVRRQVWGYAKLSPVTRAEMSRTELALPPLEYDTNALWIDAEACALRHCLPRYDHGIHALSHAILAVSPLFTSCSSTDIDCDHSLSDNTKVLIFDTRPGGGTHTTEQIWKQLHLILPAALAMLEDCPMCQMEQVYDFGCPSCLQGIPCTNFHDGLSRKAAIVIGRRMLARMQKTEYFMNCASKSHSQARCPHENGVPCTPTKKRLQQESPPSSSDGTPLKLSRAEALKRCKDLTGAKNRQFVIGRPSWPMDIVGGAESGIHSRADNDFETYIIGPSIANAAGYMAEVQFPAELQMPE